MASVKIGRTTLRLAFIHIKWYRWRLTSMCRHTHCLPAGEVMSSQTRSPILVTVINTYFTFVSPGYAYCKCAWVGCRSINRPSDKLTVSTVAGWRSRCVKVTGLPVYPSARQPRKDGWSSCLRLVLMFTWQNHPKARYLGYLDPMRLSTSGQSAPACLTCSLFHFLTAHVTQYKGSLQNCRMCAPCNIPPRV